MRELMGEKPKSVIKVNAVFDGLDTIPRVLKRPRAQYRPVSTACR
jgi:hypothetical protein